MQPAQFANGFVAGTQEEVVSIAQDDFCVEVFNQLARQKTFDGRLRTDGHKHRSFDIAMRSMQNPRARAGGGAGGLEFESEQDPIVRVVCVGLSGFADCKRILGPKSHALLMTYLITFSTYGTHLHGDES
jgi:hypothetical protein